jgi:uracil-DNA glycosylase family 4
MNNDLKALYLEIFGDRINNFEYGKKPYTYRSPNNNKCLKCKDTCGAHRNRQDLPYLVNANNVEVMVVAEAPGSGEEDGVLGSAFGWELFGKGNRDIDNYEYFFFNLLGLNKETTYITDAVKCYTHKSQFKKPFEHCKEYLRREIEILKPKTILLISKQGPTIKFLNNLKDKMDFDVHIMPHPSKQNISKIKTVADIFKSVGSFKQDKDWVKIGDSISGEYAKFTKN